MANSLQPHELQHARLPCPLPTPGVHPNSCALSQWCHPAISSLCRPLLLLPPITPSIFSNESTLCMRWPKYWSFSFSITPSKEYPGLISFRMDWLDLLSSKMLSKAHLTSHSRMSGSRWVIRKHYYEQSQWRWWNSRWAISNPTRWCCESAALNMPANLENSAVATRLEKVNFHSNPKERQCQRMAQLSHNCTHLTR